MQDKGNLVWIDMEMTGLDPQQDRVLEIAVLVTDSELNLLAEGPVIAVHQPDAVLEKMSAWCQEHHGASGLTQRVRKSTVTEQEAEAQVLAFVRQWVPEKTSPLCGNSIGQDRRFLVAYMPKLAEYFHYRNLDVSTVKILAQRWYPAVAAGLVKKEAHLALDDIKESIQELRYYREKIFR